MTCPDRLGHRSSGRSNKAEVDIHDEGSILTKVSIETQKTKIIHKRERSQPPYAKINV